MREEKGFFAKHEKKFFAVIVLALIVGVFIWNSRLPKSPDFSAIDSLVEIGSYGKALERLVELGEKKKSPEAYAFAAKLFLMIGNKKENPNPRSDSAIGEVRRYAGLDHEYGNYESWDAGQCYFRAQEMAQKAVKLKPDDSELLAFAGSVYFVRSNFEKAREYFMRAISAADSNKKRSNYHFLMAASYNNEQIETFSRDETMYEEAISHIEKSLEYNSYNDRAYEVYGNVLLYAKQWDEVRDKYEEALWAYREKADDSDEQAIAKNARWRSLDTVGHIFLWQIEWRLRELGRGDLGAEKKLREEAWTELRLRRGCL